MNRTAGPFRPAVVLGLLLAGAAAFLLLLYALGAGWTGQHDNNGGAHAAGKGLNGFAGLVTLLRASGHQVSLSRTPAGLETRSLLVLTPQHTSDPTEIEGIILKRMYQGPTIVVLPKWIVKPIGQSERITGKPGWVLLGGAYSPPWFSKVEAFKGMKPVIGPTKGWSGLGLSGPLPDPKQEQGFVAKNTTGLLPIIHDTEGDIPAGYLDRGGYHPDLADAAGISFTPAQEDEQDDNKWPLVIVAEPDLLDNYGLANRATAQEALRLVDASMDGANLPVVFDLTLPGLGASDNLLTLAFRPPFLAATLALLLAALVIAWRGLARFGPAYAQEPDLAHGKAQLAKNGAALVERAHRWHLLGAPYAALVAARLSANLGLPARGDDEREGAIDRALASRDPQLPSFTSLADTLRRARKPADLIRAASALRTLERTISR